MCTYRGIYAVVATAIHIACLIDFRRLNSYMGAVHHPNDIRSAIFLEFVEFGSILHFVRKEGWPMDVVLLPFVEEIGHVSHSPAYGSNGDPLAVSYNGV